MRNSIKVTAFILITSMVIIACGPKVEKELERFDRITSDLREAALIYPAFAEPFNTQLDKWTEEWPNVQKENDEKVKAKAMKDFNDEIYKIVGKIKDYEKLQNEINKLPGKINDQLRKYSGKYSELKRYVPRLPIAEQKGMDAIKNAVDIIRNATPQNYNEAYNAFRDAVLVLKNGREDLRNMDNEIDTYIKKQQLAESEAEKDK